MAKARTQNTEARSTASDRPRTAELRPAAVDGAAVARRAYNLYLARGCEDGHDIDDWLQAERELRGDT